MNPQLEFLQTLRERPPATEAAWRALYEQWRGRTNIEALILIGEIRGWRAPAQIRSQSPKL